MKRQARRQITTAEPEVFYLYDGDDGSVREDAFVQKLSLTGETEADVSSVAATTRGRHRQTLTRPAPSAIGSQARPHRRHRVNCAPRICSCST